MSRGPGGATAASTPRQTGPVHVAFFRNLNQGQRGSPAAADLIDAFTRAGASRVVLFQANGTVLFEAMDAAATTASAAGALAAAGPWGDVAHVRSLPWIVALVARLTPLAGSGLTDARRVELSFFDEGIDASTAVPITGRRCVVIDGGPGYAVTVNERVDESNATPTLERVLGVRATSRGLPTVQRLIQRA